MPGGIENLDPPRIRTVLTWVDMAPGGIGGIGGMDRGYAASIGERCSRALGRVHTAETLLHTCRRSGSIPPIPPIPSAGGMDAGQRAATPGGLEILIPPGHPPIPPEGVSMATCAGAPALQLTRITTCTRQPGSPSMAMSS